MKHKVHGESMNAYEILGVNTGATVSEIRRAFQLRAQICHPDRGGDSDEFKQLKEAYDILRDEERRKYYDAADMRDEYISDSEVSEKAKSELINMFVSIAEKFDAYTDYISVIKKIVTDNISVMSKSKAQLDASSKKLQKVAKRIKRKINTEGDDIFVGALLERSKKVMIEATHIANNQRICKRILEIVDDYEYDTSRESPTNDPSLFHQAALLAHMAQPR